MQGLSKDTLEAIVSSIPAGVVVIEREHGRIIYVNKRAIQLYGVDPRGLEMPDHSTKLMKLLTLNGKIFPPEELPASKALLTGKKAQDEFIIERPDGSRVTVVGYAKPVKDQSGQVIAAVAIFEDISERKEAEEALRESQERFAKAFYSSPAALSISTFPEGCIVEVNETFLKILGYKYEEVIGHTVFELNVYPDPNTRTMLAQILQKQGSFRNLEVIAQAKIKERLTLMISADIIELNGQDYALATFIDITKLKNAQEALRESEQRYRTLFSSIDEAFALHEMLFDEQGMPVDYRFLEVNEAFERQTSLKASQIIGRTVREVLPDLEPFWVETYGKVVVTGESVRFENYNQSTHRYYEVYAFRPVKGRFAVLFNDITERKRLQQRLEEYAKDLEKLVEERTRQLKEAERLATIGTTAGMVGHDIRNPLQAITGDLYLTKIDLATLPDSAAKKNMQENLQAIEQNIAYINKIVADLQDYARPLKPIIKQVDLKEIVEPLLQSSVPKNVQATYSIQADASRIVTDPDFLKRILGNLIINSVQAMPYGGMLTISAHKDAGHIIISVEDTGVGIPDEVKPKLFTPMFTTKAKGQGFGLAVVKRLTEMLGGTVSFESQVGKGTKFIVSLPT